MEKIVEIFFLIFHMLYDIYNFFALYYVIFVLISIYIYVCVCVNFHITVKYEISDKQS